jgi:hypothetical protein
MITSAGLVFVFLVFSCDCFASNAPFAAPKREVIIPAVFPVMSDIPADMSSSLDSSRRLGVLIWPSVVYCG